MRSHVLHAAWIQHDATERSKRYDYRWCCGIAVAVAIAAVCALVAGFGVVSACLLITTVILGRIAGFARVEYHAASVMAKEAWRDYQDACLRQAWGIERWLVDGSGVFTKTGAHLDDIKRGVS